MKLYAPAYYREFACIADRCPHSCCVGWEIDVDGETACRYRALCGGYGDNVRQSVEETDGVMHFVLSEGDRCPHLNERGLCRIILELGEDHLCEICREHPRFYHDTPNGKEVGLGMSCPEACRLILTSCEYRRMEEIGELAGEPMPWDFDALSHRGQIMEILSDASVPYATRLARLSEIYCIDLNARTDGEWEVFLNELEYLEDAHREMLKGFSTQVRLPKWAEAYGERFVAYLVFRHCSDVYDWPELRASVGFCLFCERLLAWAVRRSDCQTLEGLADLARILSEELEYSEENTEAVKLVFWEECV